MATVNLGRIKFVWQGAYSGATAYVADDVVSYNGSSYICILASTNNLPTNATYWSQMSSAGTNGTNGTDVGTTITTQGDILYRDASGLQRLGAGTSGQFLKTNGSGANPAWATVSSDWVRINTTTSTSSVSEILFDGVFSASYDLYKVFIYELKLSTSAQIFMQLRTTAPANQTGTSNRGWTGGDDGGNTLPNSGTSTDYRLTGRDFMNGTDRRFSAEITFNDPFKNFRTGNFYGHAQLSYPNNDYSREATIQNLGFTEVTTTQFGGFRLFPQSGTIDRAKIITYGIKIS